MTDPHQVATATWAEQSHVRDGRLHVRLECWSLITRCLTTEEGVTSPSETDVLWNDWTPETFWWTDEQEVCSLCLIRWQMCYVMIIYSDESCMFLSSDLQILLCCLMVWRFDGCWTCFSVLIWCVEMWTPPPAGPDLYEHGFVWWDGHHHTIKLSLVSVKDECWH